MSNKHFILRATHFRIIKQRYVNAPNSTLYTSVNYSIRGFIYVGSLVGATPWRALDC
jgi:hypothetical protein